MTPLEKALASGGKLADDEETPLDRALAAGGKDASDRKFSPQSYEDIQRTLASDKASIPGPTIGGAVRALSGPMNSAVDTGTFGAWSSLLGGIDSLMGVRSPNTQAVEDMQKYRREAPEMLRGVTDAPGYFMDAPVQVGDVVGRGIQMLLGKAAAPIERALATRTVGGEARALLDREGVAVRPGPGFMGETAAADIPLMEAEVEAAANPNIAKAQQELAFKGGHGLEHMGAIGGAAALAHQIHSPYAMLLSVLPFLARNVTPIVGNVAYPAVQGAAGVLGPAAGAGTSTLLTRAASQRDYTSQ